MSIVVYSTENDDSVPDMFVNSTDEHDQIWKQLREIEQMSVGLSPSMLQQMDSTLEVPRLPSAHGNAKQRRKYLRALSRHVDQVHRHVRAFTQANQ